MLLQAFFFFVMILFWSATAMLTIRGERVPAGNFIVAALATTAFAVSKGWF